jgi:hypothetical protein
MKGHWKQNSGEKRKKRSSRCSPSELLKMLPTRLESAGCLDEVFHCFFLR